jgi:hypothetical protein
VSRPILTELDAALDRWDHRLADADERRRGRIRDAVYNGHRARALANPRTPPLQRIRLNFRGDGLTVEELSERSTVSVRTIRGLEAGDRDGSDLTWLRLARALDVPRHRIDPSFVKA